MKGRRLISMGYRSILNMRTEKYGVRLCGHIQIFTTAMRSGWRRSGRNSLPIRNQMGKNLGYANFIPVGYMQQGRTDYGEKEVAAFREQVRTELVPLCEQLYAAQAKRIGVDTLMFYDEKRVFAGWKCRSCGR